MQKKAIKGQINDGFSWMPQRFFKIDCKENEANGHQIGKI